MSALSKDRVMAFRRRSARIQGERQGRFCGEQSAGSRLTKMREADSRYVVRSRRPRIRESERMRKAMSLRSELIQKWWPTTQSLDLVECARPRAQQCPPAGQ